MAIELKSYHTEDGVKTVLVNDKGWKFLHVLLMADKGLVVRKIPRTEERYFKDPIQSKKVPAMSTLVRRYRSFGATTGMTKEAKLFLREASNT